MLRALQTLREWLSVMQKTEHLQTASAAADSVSHGELDLPVSFRVELE